MARTIRKVLLVGWDAADWQMAQPLIDGGVMPTLQRLVSQGTWGNIGTLRPVLSPMLWTSIATGKRATKHGIFGFVEPAPDNLSVRNVTSTSRKTKALWNILTQSGLRTNAIGWFASQPAEPINGVCVSNAFHRPPPALGNFWPLPDGCVYPPEIADTLANLRIHPDQLTDEEIGPFLPHGAEIDQSSQEGRSLLTHFKSAFATCASVHNATTWAMEHRPWDLTAVYYNAIDDFGHHFMPFHPPQMEGVSDANFRIYKDAMTGVYRYHDMMLARLVELAGDDALIIVVSDHGFYSNHLRPALTAGGAMADPVAWHRPYGLLAMSGPNIRRDEQLYGATLLDITPTILTALGLPVGRDMDGKVLAAAFETPPLLKHINSWDDEAGEAGLHPSDMRYDALESQQAMQQLIDLGYIAAPEPGVEGGAKQVKTALRELMFNAAIAHLDASNRERGIALLESIRDQAITDVDADRIRTSLGNAYFEAGRYDDIHELFSAPDIKPTPLSDLLLGMTLAAQDRTAEAMDLLERAHRAQPRLSRLHIFLGMLHLRMNNWPSAEKAFERALEIDGDSATAYHGLSLVYGHRREYQQAAELALRAVGLQHFYPGAHFQLAAMLARLNEPQRAAACFEIGLQMQPESLIAHRYLVRLYARLGDPARAHLHQGRVDALSKIGVQAKVQRRAVIAP